MLMLAMVLTISQGALPAAGAQVTHVSLAQTGGPTVPPTGVTLGETRTETHKRPSLLVDLGALVVGTALTYVATIAGIAVNFGKGGAQVPPDANDLLWLGVVPVVTAAASTWLVGLLDLNQRTLVGSALSSLAGALVGELVGLGVGYSIGRQAAPNDVNGAVSISVLVAPVFAVVGSILFTEIFKPGETSTVSATVVPQRLSDGHWALAPGLGVRF